MIPIEFPEFGESMTLDGVTHQVVVLVVDENTGNKLILRWDQLDRHDRGVVVEMVSLTNNNVLPMEGGVDRLKQYIIPEKQQSFFDTYCYMMRVVK